MSLKDNKKALFCKNKYQFVPFFFLLTALCHYFPSALPRAPHAEHCRHKQQRQHRITHRQIIIVVFGFDNQIHFCSARCRCLIRMHRRPLVIHRRVGCIRTVTALNRSCRVKRSFRPIRLIRVIRVVCFIRTRTFTECHGISVQLHPCNPCDPYRS